MTSEVVTKIDGNYLFDPSYTRVCMYMHVCVCVCICVFMYIFGKQDNAFISDVSNPEFLNVLVFWLFSFFNMDEIIPDKELCKCLFL